MSFREEIAAIEYSFVTKDGAGYVVQDSLGWKTRDQIINKVLDAAIEAANNVHNPIQVVSTPAFLRIRNDVVDSINKLRGE